MSSNASSEGAGHFHVIADADCVDAGTAIGRDADHVHFGDGRSEGVIYLEPGQHDLCLQVGDGVHSALDITDSISVTVDITSREEWCAVMSEVDELMAEVDQLEDFAQARAGFENLARLLAQLSDRIDFVDDEPESEIGGVSASPLDHVHASLSFAANTARAITTAPDWDIAFEEIDALYEAAPYGTQTALPGADWVESACGIDLEDEPDPLVDHRPTPLAMTSHRGRRKETLMSTSPWPAEKRQVSRTARSRRSTHGEPIGVGVAPDAVHGRRDENRGLASPSGTAHPDMPGAALPRVRRREQPRIIVELLTRPHRALDRLRERYGPACTLGAGPFRMVLVGDPALLTGLFRKPVDQFRWRHRFNWFGVLVGPSSMLTNDEPEHKRLRSAVQAGFSRKRLNRWVPMIVERTDAAIDRLLVGTGPGEVVDIEPVVRSITLEVVLAALFGADFATRAAEIGELMQSGHDFVARPTPPHRLPFGLQQRVRADRTAMDAVIDTEIAERRAHPTGDPFDILEALVTDGELTDSEIRDQVVTLIGAGFDTTAAALAWTLWRATLEPDLWNRLGVEADRVLGPVDATLRPPDEHALAELDLADRVMRETLRLHPPGALTPREAAVDIDIGGYRIPATTMVVWSAHLAGRDPNTWVDPLSFDPDRFLDPTDEQQAAMRAAWVPFGHGARNCIGFALAQMELTLIVARLAQRLVMVPTTPTVPEPVGVAVNRPDGGVPMQIRER